MLGDSDIARTAALIGDPGRARVLTALGDGRELAASVLAAEAGVAPSTASAHLAKLVDGGLIRVERHGRHRYFRLAGPEVGRAIEALAQIAPPAPVRSLREGTRAHAIRQARTCYDHLAGRLGVALMAGLIDAGVLTGGDGHHQRGRARADRPSAAGRDLDYRLTDGGADRATRPRRGRRRRHGRAAGADPLLRGLERAGPPSGGRAGRRVGRAAVRPEVDRAPPAHARGAPPRTRGARACAAASASP